ncbi:ferredoxin reductase-like protein [Lichtheimia hyalospora FSU 10163]|nr:ferredoxin reductase-like protein [Lichtheimia hyalospora FSU 10163]
MRFVSNALIGSVRAATKANMQSVRTYSSQAGTKKGSNKLVLATLAAAGAAGGIYYNQNQASVAPAAAAPVEPAFDGKQFKAFKLEKVEPINHNTAVYRFSLPSEKQRAELPVASCLITRYPITKKDGSPGYIIRPYTPTSPEEAEGYFDLIVKEYAEGKMSKRIANLKVGDTLEMKGPIPKYNWDENKVENVGMIAGGTGITPMLQIIRKVFDKNSTDKTTKVTLVFANQTEEDILLKDELDSYAKEHPDRFKVVYTLDRPPKDWQGLQGFVTADAIKKYLPSAEDKNAKIFICGPDPMLASISGPKAKDKSQGEVSGILKELGYNESNVYKF